MASHHRLVCRLSHTRASMELGWPASCSLGSLLLQTLGQIFHCLSQTAHTPRLGLGGPAKPQPEELAHAIWLQWLSGWQVHPIDGRCSY